MIFPRLGRSRASVIEGPRKGGDTSVVRLDRNRVIITASDPLSYLPSIGAADSAFLSVHLLASDITTSGFPPQYGIFDFNLPMTMSDREFAKYWAAFHSECRKLGIAIIGGHTGRYLGIGDTIIGGGVLFAIGSGEKYLTSSMARTGDQLILTKGAAIETTAVLARSFPRVMRKTLGQSAFETACGYLNMVTTVKDALSAVTEGTRERGVTAMHDATEGGILSAAFELSDASGLGVTIDLDAIGVTEETVAVCKLFRLDPLYSLSEGSLLIASRPSATQRIVKRLSREHIRAMVIGQFSNRFRGMRTVDAKGHVRLAHPPRDRYWTAYLEAIRRRWS